ncbi:GNAT family N-acetyltransferase [Streptomyces gilvosporeus]|uniref:GNAT family N-acetyltransferase n=1 Tax=Streptomyces gilvosporeus TaxID=553510 RepID=A0A1V0TR43_9ACTN|nr:GNAT family N-acetyltransferase [Streptomyces gilvosporeus]ARF55406.1 GNAT family N-acetyltransferase [Streptomyces gilvosporeus]
MTRGTGAPRVRIEEWTADDIDLLHRLNTPVMTEHLGGPETEAQVAARHARYLALDGPGRMFRVVLAADGTDTETGPGAADGGPAGRAGEAVVGSVGYWELTWRGERAYETGWGVLPEFQGRGIAAAAAREVIAVARAEGRHRALYAFPSVAHAASNAVCRKAGFGFQEECEIEYPKGRLMRANNWRVVLD